MMLLMMIFTFRTKKKLLSVVNIYKLKSLQKKHFLLQYQVQQQGIKNNNLMIVWLSFVVLFLLYTSVLLDYNFMW